MEEDICSSPTTLRFIQEEYPNATYVQSGSYLGDPAGCHFYIPDQEIYFNTHHFGKRSNKSSQLCNRK